MKMNHSLASLLLTTVLMGGSATTALGQNTVPTTMIIPPSSVANPGDAGVRAHTNLRYFGPEAFTGTPQVSGPPYPGFLFETPASLACIYELQSPSDGCNPNLVTLNPAGGDRAMAIVDAYDDANAFVDLQDFSAQFGITPITSYSFRVVYAPFGGPTGACTGRFPGPQPPSAGPTGWDLEEALDIEYSHAMAPQAKLYLVEAQSNYDTDLYCAVSVASTLVAREGGGEISMGWGGPEYPGETSADSFFTKRHVVYFAAAGDGAGVIYPSASPNVVSVGGTSLSMSLNTGKYLFENTWQLGGAVRAPMSQGRPTRTVSPKLSAVNAARQTSRRIPIQIRVSGSWIPWSLVPERGSTSAAPAWPRP